MQYKKKIIDIPDLKDIQNIQNKIGSIKQELKIFYKLNDQYDNAKSFIIDIPNIEGLGKLLEDIKQKKFDLLGLKSTVSLLETNDEIIIKKKEDLQNFVKQLDIDQANSIRMISNIARISGHNPSRAISAKGTLKFKFKQGVSTDTISGGQVTIYDNTVIKNITNSWSFLNIDIIYMTKIQKI